MKLGKKLQACSFLCVWRKKRDVAINHKSFALIKGESRFSPVQHNNQTLFFFSLLYVRGSPWEDNPQRDFPLNR